MTADPKIVEPLMVTSAAAITAAIGMLLFGMAGGSFLAIVHGSPKAPPVFLEWFLVRSLPSEPAKTFQVVTRATPEACEGIIAMKQELQDGEHLECWGRPVNKP